MSSSPGTLAPPAAHAVDVTAPTDADPGAPGPEDLADVLVEEVSIDGMCGVY